MKKVFLMGTLLSLMSVAHAQNQLVVDDVELPQDGQATLTVKYQFADANTFAGCQFEVVLPTGLTFVTNGEGNAIYTPGDCYTGGVPTQSGNLVDGVESYVTNGSYDVYIAGTEGNLVTFTIQANEVMAVGQTLTGRLRNIVAGSREGVSTSLDDVTFTVTIGEPIDQRVVLDEDATTPPEAAADVDVRVLRPIMAGNWNTIVLPFAMTSDQVTEVFGADVKLADFTGVETTTDANERILSMKVNFVQATAIEANHPYLIKVSDDVPEFTVTNVTIDPEEIPSVDRDRIGSGTKKDPYRYNSFVGTYIAGITIEEQMLFLNGNKFYYSDGTVTMKGYRAYFDFYDVLSSVEGASVKLNILVDGWDTQIGDLPFVQNEETVVYDLTGRKVSKRGKGLYIIDGKKVLVK